jgi:gamma-glutamylcyclotransferase (GGCT)/AIG2-like uncharacterized protein YtfP
VYETLQCLPILQPELFGRKPEAETVLEKPAAAAAVKDEKDELIKALLETQKRLEKRLDEMEKKENRNNNSNRRGGNRRQPTGYCWTHGYVYNEKHNSQTCNRRSEGHKENATIDNKMGGSEANKPRN